MHSALFPMPGPPVAVTKQAGPAAAGYVLCRTFITPKEIVHTGRYVSKREHGCESIVGKGGAPAGGGGARPSGRCDVSGGAPCFDVRNVVVVGVATTGTAAALLCCCCCCFDYYTCCFFLQRAFQVSLRVRGAPKRRGSQNRGGAGGDGGRAGCAVRWG